ncbi:2-succinyl-5-enolpyruvyl-6-hydroxy-3-cyclohexene- 1-carboxylic-acid synthase [Lapillicoccus jejuensis]|uniref:2-succinyl-5-enolpyruvyl-6-hydroxy-3-cyclohexene-1-carboxylate synthase n=1 Tax=Lapillicoccus jejuensis TaxID=402171 RepID=A0A542DX29_9MICO|nr:2-succinyl-5-enolpyruvyl-6-hydroxy-3-cyclohexene-1-carboxylic-acid synthase [Lapillicoccus jejuensis]TQJ07649.1 2-succinyl-5-enolpyruvyl-6-hydroxy-3-cyclohexene-1-carboxylate synthase [Lapillicoccus jejuensis]
MTSADRAVTLLRALVDGGVRDVVLSPGSRSAPLALALHAADAAGDLRLHVRLDERSSGFLALGLSVGSRRPVAVVTTSGTAVGNLLPAVMEAHHSGRRLVVVSADRPAALRGTGANQTTEQEGLYGVFAPCADLAVDAGEQEVRAAALAATQRPGPSQLNLQLGEPLLPEPAGVWWPGGGAPDEEAPRRRRTDAAEPLPVGPRTVVVAGDDAGPGPRVLAQAMGWPLLAEPTSGSRAGANAIRTYRLLLGGPLGAEVERVLVTGHPTLSRPVTRLISRADLEVLAVPGAGGVVTDPARVARHLPGLPAVPEGVVPAPEDAAWLARWQAADAALSARLDALVDGLPGLDPLQVAREVGAATGPGCTLVVGSSNPVRDLDLVLAPYPPGEHRLVVGNRGLAGIDGTVSTALGVALGRPAAPDGRRPRSLALLGDVTFLHDANGLVLGPDEPRPDLTLVVVNDDGGSIFAGLEQGAPGYARAFERVFATPHHADLRALCAASGTPYGLVTDVAGLRAALADDRPGLRVVEARVGRADRRATAARIAALMED